MVWIVEHFEFVVGEDPSDVYIEIDDKLVFYKRCETPEIPKAIVNGQNESRKNNHGS